MNAKLIMTVTISFLLCTTLMASMVHVLGNPDTVTESPSAYENNQWTSPQNAYTSNNLRASESTPNSFVTYKTYGFQDSIPEGSTIDNVYVKCEGYVSSVPSQQVHAYVSWDGGSTWSSQHNMALGTSESTMTWDVSGETAWTRDKLNDTNFRVKLMYYASGGCYPNNTYFISYEKDQWILKRVSKARVGDTILVFDDITKKIKLSKISQVAIHFGKWTMLDIYSGNLTIKAEETKTESDWTWKAHVMFTANHPVEWSFDQNGLITQRGEAKDLKEGYYLAHLWHDPPYFRNEPVPLTDNSLKFFPITTIKRTVCEAPVYDILAEERFHRPFLKFLTDDEMAELIEIGEKLGIGLEMLFDPPPIGKTTGYVDWLPVKVDYTSAGKSWHDINTWTLNLTTRQWTDINNWDLNLSTMQWTDIAMWTLNLTTRQWTDISIWNLNVVGRQWIKMAEWIFKLWSHAYNPPGGDLTPLVPVTPLPTRQPLTYGIWFLVLFLACVGIYVGERTKKERRKFLKDARKKLKKMGKPDPFD